MSENLRSEYNRILESIDNLMGFVKIHPPVVSEITSISQILRSRDEDLVSPDCGEDEPVRRSIDFNVKHDPDVSADRIEAILKDFGANDPALLSEGQAKVTFKYPGVVIVPGDPEKLVSLVAQINHAKNAFATSLKKLGKNKNRFDHFDSVHNQFPGLITLQATRCILGSQQAIRKVSFFWRYNETTKSMTVSEMLTHLHGKLEYLDKMSLLSKVDSQQQAVETAIQTIQSLNLAEGESLRLRRRNSFPVPAVHISRNITCPYASDVRTHIITKASLPIFGAGEKVEIAHLPSWDKVVPVEKKTQQAGTRSRYITTELSPELGIFKVRPNYYAQTGK